jgi:hypothetical protein
MMSHNRDAQSIDSILRAVYETISGPAGPRDWDRERGLFAPGAILAPTRPRPEEGGATVELFDFDGYIASRSPFFAENDFYEWEIARQTFRFGNIAHVLSAYSAFRRPIDPEPLFRGINSLQLYCDGQRWWIVSILWDNERPGNGLPDWARVTDAGPP